MWSKLELISGFWKLFYGGVVAGMISRHKNIGGFLEGGYFEYLIMNWYVTLQE